MKEVQKEASIHKFLLAMLFFWFFPLKNNRLIWLI